MDPETQKLLRQNLKLSRENNEILTKIYSSHKRARVWSFIKALVWIALLFGAYYLVAPYVENLTDAYRSMLEALQKFQEARDAFRF